MKNRNLFGPEKEDSLVKRLKLLYKQRMAIKVYVWRKEKEWETNPFYF